MKPYQHVLALLRLSMGWIFLWAFLDKLFGFGFATAPEKAWLSGGSPTSGFLTFGTHGPLSPFFKLLAGEIWVDWLFMLGLLCIGLALICGIGMRIAAWTGSVLMIFMWLALLPPKNNPFMDEHVIYMLVLIALNSVHAGDWWGFGKTWSKTNMVKKYPFLR